MIQIVPMFQVDAVWPHLKDGMETACSKGGGQYTHDWLWTLCRKGDAFLIVAVEDEAVKGGVVCQVQNWTGRMVLNVLAACGRDMKSWLQAMTDYGLAQFGVQAIVFEGREGWRNVVPGVRVVRCVYEVKVT